MNQERMVVADEVRSSLAALAAHRARHMPVLLPPEDRAIVSLMGKLGIMAEFLELPAEAAESLRAMPAVVGGEAVTMDGAIALGRAMARDVMSMVVSTTEH